MIKSEQKTTDFGTGLPPLYIKKPKYIWPWERKKALDEAAAKLKKPLPTNPPKGAAPRI